jgi:5-methylcytosine-specific restriction endonuclease McrA
MPNTTTWVEPRDAVYHARQQLQTGEPLSVEQALELVDIIADQRAVIALQDDRIAELAPAPRYQDYLKSPEWEAMRTQALAFFGHRCQLCNSPEKLQAHHRTYARLGQEDITDLIVLCDTCHRRHHRFMR